MEKKLDELGRVVIPLEMRNKLSLENESVVNIDCVDNKIILTKLKPCCIVCHSADNVLFGIEKILVCSECINKIKAI